jgi:quercetin dioxygenase-like cupin family protein
MPESQSEYLRTHDLAGDAIVLHLDEAATELWNQTGARERMAHTLVKHGGLSVVLTAIRAGGDLAEHQAAGPVTAHVLGGRARVQAAGVEQTLVEGDVIAFGPGVRHSLRADEDTLVLLTIAAAA